MKKLIIAVITAFLLSTVLASCGSSGGRPNVRFSYGVGIGHFGYGYRPWSPCRFGCGPPIIVEPRPPSYPEPELPYEPPIFEATPLPSMDFDMDFGEW